MTESLITNEEFTAALNRLLREAQAQALENLTRLLCERCARGEVITRDDAGFASHFYEVMGERRVAYFECHADQIVHREIKRLRTEAA